MCKKEEKHIDFEKFIKNIITYTLDPEAKMSY